MTEQAQAAPQQEQQQAQPQKKTRKSQYQARLENQKAQLERHGNFAEVVIRTTPEGTDMINFARLWEYVLVQADRNTRGYIAKSSREDFEQTRADFEASVDFMVSKIKEAVDRHDMDLSGTNFISRVAQRYHIAERKSKAKPAQPKQETSSAAEAAPKAAETPAEAPAAVATDEVESF